MPEQVGLQRTKTTIAILLAFQLLSGFFFSKVSFLSHVLRSIGEFLMPRRTCSSLVWRASSDTSPPCPMATRFDRLLQLLHLVFHAHLANGLQLYKTDVGATGRIRKEANRRLVGNVVVGERTFLVDSKFNEVWVESIDCEVSPTSKQDSQYRDQVSAWSDWSSCSKSCNWGSEPGQSRRGRDVVTQPTFGGASCLDLGQAKTCNQFPCPVNCEVNSSQS